jgi:hypothetical protein
MILFTQIVSVLLVGISMLVVALTNVNDRANGKAYVQYAKVQHGSVVAGVITMLATPGMVALFLTPLLWLVPPERAVHGDAVLNMVVLNWIGIAIVGYIIIDLVRWSRSKHTRSSG